MAVSAGLREGELLRLRWTDVDLSGATGMLQVRRTLSEARSGRIFEALKSGKGRQIRLTKKATGPSEPTASASSRSDWSAPGSGEIRASCCPRR
jgi:hypothetical protein